MLLIYNMNIGFLFNMHELLESVDQYHLESMDDNGLYLELKPAILSLDKDTEIRTKKH
jgi:hypothetical protein